jgi:N utilization substance protein A
MLGRAIVLVREDQLSLAIGKRGQNVRLASKLCGWDIEIMTRDELDEQIERAVLGFSSLQGVESELAEKLVGEGFLSYDDLSIIEPDALMEMGGLSEEQSQLIVAQAESKALDAEKVAAEQRRQRREQDRTATTAEVVEEGPGGESTIGEIVAGLPADDGTAAAAEPPVAAAELNLDSDAGSSVPPTVAEDLPSTDHSGDVDHRENT